jgi:tetratricopeptide (TPR) repeat protein
MAHPLDHIRTALAAQYRVERELGHGGMANVYLAEDVKHGRSVAIKVLDPDLAGLLGPDRFLREIRNTAQLQHPNILPLLDSGATEGLLYYVMPYVKGESLRAHLDSSRQLPLDEALRLATEVAHALDYSNRQGIVHRDIKPENILLADGHAVVADFGIARAIRAAGGERLTQTGVTLGSPPYMSPEQGAGSEDVDGRSDLYSLGCLLYEMLAGQPPFSGPAETLAYQHLNLTPRPVRELRPTVPPPVDGAIIRALAKTPADRYATSAEFAAALGAGTTATPSPATPSPPATRHAPRARSPRTVGIALAAVLVAIAAVAFVLWRSGAIHSPTAANAANRRWVWLADFEGPAGDPSLAPTARELVAAALDQSELLASVPGDQVRIALRNAGRPDSTRMIGDVARELAFRSTIPVVVEGRIGKLGTSYSIVLKATNSEDGRVIHSTSGEAPNDRELAPVLARLARDLRRGLGERPQALSAALGTDIVTPSFEAFKLFVRGRTRLLAGDPRGAIALFRQAVAIDPEFAAAWSGMGTAMGNEGSLDSALVMQREALRHAERLTAVRRFDIEGKIARYLGDSQASINAFDAILELNPSPVDRASALNNKALSVGALGRNREALELYQESARIFPIEPPQITLGNVVQQLTGLKRFDEARAMLPRLRGPNGQFRHSFLAIAQRSWNEADSTAAILVANPAASGPQQIPGRAIRLSVRAARGDMTSARRMNADVLRTLITEGNTDGVGIFWIENFWLSRVTESEPAAVPAVLRGTPWGVAASATRAALAGDSVAVRALVASWPDSSKRAERAVVAAHAEGLLDWKRGRWERAAEHLAPSARVSIFLSPTIEEVFRQPARWIVADAFSRLGQRDSAVVYLQLMLDPPPAQEAIISRGLWEPFARSRLVTLYAELGRLDDARREWEILSETTTQPDPQVAALLDDTRARLQGARAMRVGARR